MRKRARRLFAVAAALSALVAAGASGLVAAPEGEREISFYHIHTKETLTVVYKRNGKYIPEAMDKIDWLMRDWRQNKAIKMDPATIDILWEIHTELGSKEPMHVVCGYRSGTTNEMLRRSVGGQAKNSQHITGKAIDVYFPDVPSKFARYAGLVRERGGVGYYPTSALPFVHIDTGRVRHWPKIGKDELALLFPSGRSKHVSSGGSLRPGDYERAKSRNKELVAQVLAYNDLRTAPAPATGDKSRVLVAMDLKIPALKSDKSKPAATVAEKAPPAPQLKSPPVLAALGPAATQKSPAPVTAPKLVAAPRLVERPSKFAPRPTEADRKGLDKLVTLAALELPAIPLLPPPQLVAAPRPAVRPAKADQPSAGAVGPVPGPRAELAPQEGSYDPENELDEPKDSVTAGWVPAPEFDEDHPEELAYRPFPLAPLLTASASLDDPALTRLVHPDLARTLAVIDDIGEVQPMRFRPAKRIAELMLAQQFRGEAVQDDQNLAELDQKPAPAGLASRPVKTSLR